MSRMKPPPKGRGRKGRERGRGPGAWPYKKHEKKKRAHLKGLTKPSGFGGKGTDGKRGFSESDGIYLEKESGGPPPCKGVKGNASESPRKRKELSGGGEKTGIGCRKNWRERKKEPKQSGKRRRKKKLITRFDRVSGWAPEGGTDGGEALVLGKFRETLRPASKSGGWRKRPRKAGKKFRRKRVGDLGGEGKRLDPFGRSPKKEKERGGNEGRRGHKRSFTKEGMENVKKRSFR